MTEAGTGGALANYLDSLIARVGDSTLQAGIRAEVARLRDNKQFGLVFERHLPETIRLPGYPIKHGLTVQDRADHNSPTWIVTRVVDGKAHVTRRVDDSSLNDTRLVADLVVVREYGSNIYPGLQSVGCVERGGDKPYHVVINAENYHALEAMLYVYEGQVDVIYIDPPYNTGARDWTYNNDYVEANDSYRHSKWLSFMERRLQLARPLLKPDGVLIVTIDEHEGQNLGVLLAQTFRDARIQMVTIVTNTAGSTSPGLFSRSDEYAYFCFFGDSRPGRMTTDLLADSKPTQQFWFPLFRSRGLNDRPSKRSNLVYPIAVDPETLQIVGAGRSLKDRVDAGEVTGDLDSWHPDPSETLDGCPVVWPVLDTGEVTTWQVGSGALSKLIEQGFVRVRRPRQAGGPRPFIISYIKSGNQKKILAGEVPVSGHEASGAVIVTGGPRTTLPKTTWKVASHDARLYGTTMLRSLLGSTSFTYPKSPYAVLDALQTVVGDKSNALVLDFFAGSGTTLQALAMLNRMDNGQRRCILVTNNEVPESVASILLQDGLRPGDAAYESRGIARAVTFPRVRATLTGLRPDGTPAPDQYLDGTDIADGLDENAIFMELTYLDRNELSRGKAFEAIAPLLWLKAGATGARIETVDGAWSLPNSATYGVLFDPQQWSAFVGAVQVRDDVRHAFVVTDSLAIFQQVAQELPASVKATMLYEDYLSTFEINTESGR